MNLLQNIQSMLGQKGSGGGLDNLANLLAPAALGGLVGALLTNKTAREYGMNALLIGGGAVLGTTLWNKYKSRLTETHSNEPAFGAQQSSPQERASRLVRALVFAAKSDGHIDEKEQQAIQSNLKQLGVGAESERLVQEAVAQPLDPNLIAKDVKTEEEALEVYLVSCAVINIDHFMERSYLDALAMALKIPDDVKQGIEADLKQA